MEKYISAEAAAGQLRSYTIERDLMVSHNDTIDFAISVISAEVHAADVVSRDCYDRILAQNDTMREMLAQIGKKPGDKMDDVRVALRSEWIINDVGDNTLYAKCKHCLTTQVLYGGKQPTNFCPNCGANMTTKTGR